MDYCLPKVPFNQVVRTELYANLKEKPYDSFQHFNSKLLAPNSSNGAPTSISNESTPPFGSIFGGSGGSVQSIRQLFDAGADKSSPHPHPPGLQRSSSDLRPKSNSFIVARPGQPNLVVCDVINLSDAHWQNLQNT